MQITRFSKIGWFIAIWVASVSALGIVAYGIRLAIHS
jgi:hypothetical protein